MAQTRVLPVASVGKRCRCIDWIACDRVFRHAQLHVAPRVGTSHPRGQCRLRWPHCTTMPTFSPESREAGATGAAMPGRRHHLPPPDIRSAAEARRYRASRCRCTHRICTTKQGSFADGSRVARAARERLRVRELVYRSVAYLTRAVDVQDSAARWTGLVARPLEEGNQSAAVGTGSLETVDFHGHHPMRAPEARECDEYWSGIVDRLS